MWALSEQEFNVEKELGRVSNSKENNSFVYRLLEHVLNDCYDETESIDNKTEIY